MAQSVGQGRPRIVVDLSGTTFMDSSGLGALVAGLRSARQGGGNLRIANLNEQVRMASPSPTWTVSCAPTPASRTPSVPAEPVCTLTLDGPADLPCLERVHDLVDELWARVPDVEPTDRYRFETAVIEVAGNIVEHGGADVRLELPLVAAADRVEAHSRDTGTAVDHEDAAGRLPEPMAEQGRGMALARAAVDANERSGTSNCWHVLQRRAGCAPDRLTRSAGRGADSCAHEPPPPCASPRRTHRRGPARRTPAATPSRRQRRGQDRRAGRDGVPGLGTRRQRDDRAGQGPPGPIVRDAGLRLGHVGDPDRRRGLFSAAVTVPTLAAGPVTVTARVGKASGPRPSP